MFFNTTILKQSKYLLLFFNKKCIIISIYQKNSTFKVYPRFYRNTLIRPIGLRKKFPK